MIDEYANTQLPWKKAGATDDYNQPTYPTASTIRCRVEFREKLIRTSMTETVMSMATLYTKTPVSQKDKITIDGVEWIVIASEPLRDLAGTIEFYEVML